MPNVGDLVEVVHRYNCAGQIVVNTYGFECLDATSSFAALAGDLATAANGLTKVMSIMRTDITTLDITVRAVEPSTPAAYVYTTPPLPAGAVTVGSAGDLLPPQAAWVVKWSTGLAGRSYRGRTYFSGLSEGLQASGVWTSANVTFMDTNLTAFLARYRKTAGVNGDWGLVVISRVNNGVVRPTPIGTEITGFTSRTIVYTQRRRTVGVGS